MAFARPTLSDLVTRIQADFVSRLSLTGAVLRRANVYVLSRVMAGAAHMLHGHLDFLARQLFPDKSEAEFLTRQASLFIGAPIPAGFAKGTLTCTGTNTTVIPAGSALQRSDGAVYTTDADVTIALGTATPSVTSVLAGADQTLTVGVVLAFQSPIAGVDSSAVVVTSTQDGSNTETTEELRVRLLAYFATPANGGSDADYIAWAKTVSGVTRVWVSDQELGPGTVSIRFARDNDVSPIPDSGEVAAVQAAIDARKPAHATPTVIAPTASPLNFTVHIVPDTAATEAAVTAELTDMLLRTGAPGVTTLLSGIQTAVGSAADVTDYTVTVPAANVTHTANQLPTIGIVTFV